MMAKRVGYMSEEYAATLLHVGKPVHMQNSQTWCLRRRIENTNFTDVSSSYPLLSCGNWAGLGEDLDAGLDGAVSFVAVTDPLQVGMESLGQLNLDVLIDFKPHQIVDLKKPLHQATDKRHLSKARRALKKVSVERVTPSSEIETVWLELYGELVRRHQIQGAANFPTNSLCQQLYVPGAEVFAGLVNGEIVSMILMIVDEGNVYYHLGAHSLQGYAANASFGMFATIIDHYFNSGRSQIDLGSSAGTSVEADDGLLRFKRGWSTDVKSAYLIGKVLDEKRYAELTGSRNTTFFPAYRA